MNSVLGIESYKELPPRKSAIIDVTCGSAAMTTHQAHTNITKGKKPNKPKPTKRAAEVFSVLAFPVSSREVSFGIFQFPE